MEATTGFEPVIEVLQTSALPLGYVALVPRKRLELLRLAARPPQDRVSTYSTTWAAMRRAGSLGSTEASSCELAPSTVSFICLAGVEGLEPPTGGFGGRCSSN